MLAENYFGAKFVPKIVKFLDKINPELYQYEIALLGGA